MASKSKSGLSEAKGNKTTPPTPKVSKVSKAGAPKPAHGSPSPNPPRTPADKSPRSADSKTPSSVERRSPKIASKTTTPPDKQVKSLKPSELQTQLAAVQEDLKKAKEQLAAIEKEKAQVLEELEVAKRSAEEANAKLQEALNAQKKAEEASEIERFRAVELEQTSIDSVQKREKEWQKKLKSMQNQQSADAAALRSTVEQLEKARYELADAIDAKNSALSHADDAMKAAEVNAEKVEILSVEVSRLNALLDSELDHKAKEAAELIRKLESEASALKLELEKAKGAEEKAVDLEKFVEGLQVDVTNAKKAESDAKQSADEWKKNADLLAIRLEEADQSNKLKADSLDSAMKELDATSALLQEKESELTVFKDKIRSLEIEVARHKEDVDVSSEQLDAAGKEAFDLRMEIEELKSKLQNLEEEKMEAINSEKLARSNINCLTDEKNKLAMELEASKDECEKVKKAMEDLASALHEVSAEARDAQEKFLKKQEEIENAHAQIEELNKSLKNTQESYELTLDEANYERVCLKKTVKRLETESKNATEEWQSKELSFVNSIRKSEEEIIAVKVQMDKVVETLRGKEDEVEAAKQNYAELQDRLKQMETQVTEADKARDEAQAASLQWKEKLLDKENELQNIKQENDDLQIKESASLKKIEELSALLADATGKKTKADGAIPSSEKANYMKDERANSGAPKEDGNDLEDENEKGSADEDEPVVVIAKMWDNSKVTDYDSSKERENDGESEVDLESNKGDNGLDHKMNNGMTSPTKQQQQQKKKPLLKKFGGLLKKKSQH